MDEARSDVSEDSSRPSVNKTSSSPATMPSLSLSPSLWETVKCDFKSLFPEDVFQMWFEPVVCLESTLYPNRDIDTVISVEAFANKLRLNGKVLPEYREKTFPGRSGDLLHRLQVGYLRHGQKPAVAAAGAAAGAAAEPVRRGGRARKRKVIFDNSRAKEAP